MPELVTTILSRAIRLIELEEPRAYREIAWRLDGMTIGFYFEEILCLEARRGELYLSIKPGQSDIEVRGDRKAVVELIGGQYTLSQMVYSGRLDIVGAIGKLTRGLSAVEYFISALLRIDDAKKLVSALEAAS